VPEDKSLETLRSKIFIASSTIQAWSGIRPYSMSIMIFSPGVKPPDPEPDHPSSASVKVKNITICISTYPFCLHVFMVCAVQRLSFAEYNYAWSSPPTPIRLHDVAVRYSDHFDFLIILRLSVM
jgi:hypothetical protein